MHSNKNVLELNCAFKLKAFEICHDFSSKQCHLNCMHYVCGQLLRQIIVFLCKIASFMAEFKRQNIGRRTQMFFEN